MNLSIEKSQLAKIDLIENSEYISKDSLKAADKFLQSADETFKLIQANPRIGIRVEIGPGKRREIRCAQVNRFPNFLVYYHLIEDRIEILRVVHGAREKSSLLDGL